MTLDASAGRRATDDAVALLEADHAATRELLALSMRPGLAPRSRERVVLVLAEDLWIHMQIEEEIFYPALAGSPTGLDRAPAARNGVREMLSRLEHGGESEDDFLRLAKDVLALHEEDAADQERRLFPHARRVLGARALAALAAEMRTRRRQLLEAGNVRREPPPTCGLAGLSA